MVCVGSLASSSSPPFVALRNRLLSDLLSVNEAFQLNQDFYWVSLYCQSELSGEIWSKPQTNSKPGI
jgi:hypothetical protein